MVYHRLMLLCVDLDGVVYRGSEPVPGVGPLLAARPELVTVVPVEGENPDVDTPEDLARLVAPPEPV